VRYQTIPLTHRASFSFEHFVLRTYLPRLYETSDSSALSVPKAYAGVIAVNLIASSLMVVALGFKVGAARRVYQEKAEKSGDKDAKER
jgi:hypothetical protein